ncbi:hypothetical protein C1N71_12235 [Agrococcus sp. SGAir0287]|nr:hypothetical protein C1N71_12235 [Agrococcus sp. SGAir0287]
MAAAGPEPRGFTLLVPPSWRRFTADEAGRRSLEAALTERLRPHGRPDVEGLARSMVRAQWRRLEQQRAFAISMPIDPSIEGGTPISIVVMPWASRSGDLETDLRARVSSDVERIETEVGPVLRWIQEVAPSDEAGDAPSRHISYLFPFPIPDARRGALVRAAIVHPGVEEGGPALEAFTRLVDSIAETFRWRV